MAGPHVEEPGDLASLRAHMKEMHGLGTAHMLPARVLMHVHEKDHAEGGTDWDGSPDASRAPRFIARRHSWARGTGSGGLPSAR